MKIRSRVFAILIFMFAAAVSVAQSRPAETSAKPTIVIVHGAWGGSWAFRQIDAMLRRKGFEVRRPQLTGLGERVHLSKSEIGLSTHIDDVVNMILYEDLHDIVLVGHSYGGLVITGVADRVPERIRELVYVDAFIPNDGESVMGLVGASDWLKSMIKDEYIVPSWMKSDQPPPHDVPQPLKTFTDAISLRIRSRANFRRPTFLPSRPAKKRRRMIFGHTRTGETAWLARAPVDRRS